MKNKKGTWFNFALVIVMIVVLSMAYLVLSEKESKSTGIIGTKQLALIKTYQKADKALLYIDEAARLSVDYAIYKLSERGGFRVNSDCGSLEEYRMWNNNDKFCFPDYNQSFSFFVVDSLDIVYLHNYEDIDLALANYDILLIQNPEKLDVLGFAAKNIDINIYDMQPNIVNPKIGSFSVKPNFNVSADFNLNIFSELFKDAKELIPKCKDEIDVKSCVETNKPKEWNIANHDLDKRIFAFDVPLNKKAVYFDAVKNEISVKEVIVKFGVYIGS